MDVPTRRNEIRTRSSWDPRAPNCWAIDVRSAALARITIGVLLIFHAIEHLRLYRDLYSPDGILPSVLLPMSREIPYFPSLLSWLELYNWGFPAFLLMTAVSYLALIAGWKTRMATITSLCVFSTICHRNPYLVIGSDELIGSVLLWFCLLPLGARFSIDCLVSKDRQHPLRSTATMMPTWASLCVLIQLCTVYFVTAWRKSGPTWWADGTALDRILGMSTFRLPGAAILESLPDWGLQGLTRGVLVIEYAIPCLILCPIWQTSCRRLAILSIWCLHLGIAMTIDTGLFSMTMLASSVVLLTPADWKLIEGLALVLRSKFEPDRIEQNVAAPRKTNRWIAELGALFLFLGFVQENCKQSLGARASDVTIPIVSIPWHFAAAAQRWTMFAPDPPRTDPQISVHVEMTDSESIIAWNNHDHYSYEGVESTRNGFLWKLFVLRAAMMLDRDRRSEGESLRCTVCDFFIKRHALAQVEAEPKSSPIHSSHSVDHAEMWVTLVPTRPRRSDPLMHHETACVARLDSDPTHRR